MQYVPDTARIQVPLKQTGELRPVKVWDWAGEGCDMGDKAAQYLSAYFGKPVRLLKYAGEPSFYLPALQIEITETETHLNLY